jgi:hypothetical protein
MRGEAMMTSHGCFVALTMVTFVTAAVPAAGHQEDPEEERGETERLTRRAQELTELLRLRPLDPTASAPYMELCETRERLYQYHQAARCYEKVSDSWPTLPVGRDALWVAAQLRRRLQEFEISLAHYTRIALDAAFEPSRRRDARGMATVLRRLLKERKVPRQPVPDPDRRPIGRSGGEGRGRCVERGAR